MYVCTSEIVKKANKIVDLCGTRDPHKIARELGVEILYYPFNRQRGAYKVIMRNRFMFIKNDLHPVMKNKGISIHHCCGSWKSSFNKRFAFNGNVGMFAHLLKWASRKRRTWLAARNNEFTECHRAALRGRYSEFDISHIYTVENPYDEDK